MCGIAGFVVADRRYVPGVDLQSAVTKMSDILEHRGPDSSGVWVDQDRGVALAHRRLAVLDPTPAGNQPMVSRSGRYVVTYNGEIYNHLALRRDLDREGVGNECARRERRRWNGTSDTETLVEAIDAWGIELTVQRSVGMFAMAVWDRHRRTLSLARDRMGEKPLYYTAVHGGVAFASELKALRAGPFASTEIDRSALASYLRWGYVPAPTSILAGVRKVAPGTVVELREAPYQGWRGDVSTSFWAPGAGFRPSARGLGFNSGDVADRFHEHLRAAVAGQMLADVPLGAFLSGGVDSALIVALMQEQSPRPVKTFTIGLEHAALDESRAAESIAASLGTDHTVLRVGSSDALGLIPDLPSIYDEPFADSSQIPTILLCRLASRDVTVALSGDGGDELFGGYVRYEWVRRLWRAIGWQPRVVRKLLARMLTIPDAGVLTRGLNVMSRRLPLGIFASRGGDRIHKLAAAIDCQRDEGQVLDLYHHVMSSWASPHEVVLGVDEHARDGRFDAVPATWPPVAQMMLHDTLAYIPDDILVKVDRAAMSASLETRIPLLDHRVVEYVWSLPLDVRVRVGDPKWLPRALLARYLPLELVDRPKSGFTVPMADWLKGPLRDWAEDLISDHRLDSDGYFDPGQVRTVWKEHLEGHRDWTDRLWTVLMFQAWLHHQSPEG